MSELVIIRFFSTESDLIPAVATFLFCLFLRLEIGIAIGIGINVIFLLYQSARPSVHVEKVMVGAIIVISFYTLSLLVCHITRREMHQP